MSEIQQTVSLIIEDHFIEVEKSLADLLNAPPVKLWIDGEEITIKATSLAIDPATNKPFARPTTIYDAATEHFVKKKGEKHPIPVLCHREHLTPVAVCRFCVVDVGFRDAKDPSKPVWRGGRLTPACHRQVEANMDIQTSSHNERIKKSVGILTELLLADHDTPREAHKEYGDNELRTIAKQFGIDQSRFPRTARDRGYDESSLVIAVDHNACILCDRCIRGCNEIRNNQVLGRANKGYRARIAFDLNDPMGESSCVSCGECMVSCPTGALTNRKFVQPLIVRADQPGGGEVVDPNSLFSHPLFEGVSVQFMGWNKGSVVRRRFKKGDIICREGEFGNSAFVIEKGSVEIFINSRISSIKAEKGPQAKTRGGFLGLVQQFTIDLLPRRGIPAPDDDEGYAPRRYIPVDAPTVLELKDGNVKPAAILDEKDVIFGEMSCMNNYPRSATVRAASDEVVVLEILRNVLYVLQRSKKSKAILDRVYKDRAIAGHLRSVPIFSELQKDEGQFQKFVTAFKDSMTLVRLNPGEVIFKQDDPADAFYLVRVGFVKVSQQSPGGEQVLSYIGPGGFFGEIALLADLPEMQGRVNPRRTATCQALDHVDVVKISGEDFQRIVQAFPIVRQQLVKEARKRLEENEATRQKVESVPMAEFVRQGLMNAQSLLVLDLTKCTRCDECTKACSDAHEGVTRLIREGLRFENFLVASSCRACLDPYCMVGCPVDAIHRKKSREMKIEDWCIGCGTCAKNCPYGNINMHGYGSGETVADTEHPGGQKAVLREKATMCDLCSELDGEPSCVYACPHDAAHRYNADQFREVLAKQTAARGK